MIGARLKSARIAKGLTQTALAKLVPTSQSYVAQLESNDRECSQEVLRGLADALDVTPGYLMGDSTQDMAAEYLVDPRAAIVRDQDAPPGLRDLAADADLCAVLQLAPAEWAALRSLAVSSPPSKNGYLVLLHVLRATCPA